jgi:hypothetical protein
MDKVTLGQVSFPALPPPPAPIISPTTHTELGQQVAVTANYKWEKPRKIQQRLPLWKCGTIEKNFP